MAQATEGLPRQRTLEELKAEVQARAALARWVGDAASRPIAEKLPTWENLPPREDITEGLASHPELEAADANIAAQQAAADLAEQKYKPGWALDLGYSFREGNLPDATPR